MAGECSSGERTLSCSPPGVATPRCGGARPAPKRGPTAAEPSPRSTLREPRQVFIARLDPNLVRDDPGGDLLHRDRALVPRLAHERREPLEQRDPAVLEAGQERQVDKRPHQPPEEAAHLDAL